MTSPTQFAWSVLAMGGYPPPAGKGHDDMDCWLCGGPTDGVGWARSAAIPSTFASHNMARRQTSGAVCQACAALAGGGTWQRYLDERRPEGVKAWGTASWRNYGHFFAAPDHHECPRPSRWRDLLLDPPEGRFLAVISLSGQKNLIFRGMVATDRDAFPVQLEDERVLVVRADLAAATAIVDEARAAGFTREAIATGRYPQHAIMAAGLARWREIKAAVEIWRRHDPSLLNLAIYISKKPDEPSPKKGPLRNEKSQMCQPQSQGALL